MEPIMKLFKLLVLSTALVTSGLLATSGTASAADPEPDSIVVLAKHTEAKPDDPVKVQFTSFKVVKASFDPKKVEGGKATVEIDATSVKTGIDKRDAHLNTPDFLDTKKFPKIVVEIDKVKNKSGKTYTAEATVKFRDVTKKIPLTFDVVDQTADGIRIKGEGAFSRLDFKVGKDSTNPKEAPAQKELVVQVNLMLKPTK
jgi:polyisoprenoid-binding protein YceI